MMYNEKYPSDLRDRFLDIVKDEVTKLGPEFSPLATKPAKAPKKVGTARKKGM